MAKKKVKSGQHSQMGGRSPTWGKFPTFSRVFSRGERLIAFKSGKCSGTKIISKSSLGAKCKKGLFWDIDNARRIEGSNLERPLMFRVLESYVLTIPRLGLNGPAGLFPS